jgi:NAD(P)-dependent dehydrogenase (short-subunit alcohol dehydrogenase family)
LTSIEGAVALVTGGKRGLGRAFVDALPRHGAAKVYATARKPVPSGDPRVVVETLDVTDPSLRLCPVPSNDSPFPSSCAAEAPVVSPTSTRRRRGCPGSTS